MDEEKPLDPEKEESADKSGSPNVLKKSKNILTAWKTYLCHPVRDAGLGLALLYMTVLGFANITYGYILTQNVPEYLLGIFVAISALVGVIGSTAYPHIKR